MGILEKIVLENFTVGGSCDLFHHGVLQDNLEKGNFELYGGNLYGVIGEFGNGGAALSCGITGNTNFYEGRIVVDGMETSKEHLIQNSWYVGKDLYKYNSSSLFGRKPKMTRNTIKEQIEEGVCRNGHGLSFYQIKSIFDISDERVVRNIEYVSAERWKASAAIGYVHKKKIFCYPWMNSKDIEHLKEQLSNTINVLLDFGCIVIVPTTKEENIRKISDKGQMIFL